VQLSNSTLFSPSEITYLTAQEKTNSAGVWSLTSKDGEGGYTGTVYCEIAFLALDSTAQGEVGQIVVIYRASLLDKPSTALNLTHHWGFNLGASGISKGKPTEASKIDISDHILTINSKEILNLDPETSLPTGKPLSLSTPSAQVKDFRKGRKIGSKGDGYPEAIGGLGQGYPGDGYDDFWVFDREAKPVVVQEAEKNELNVFEVIKKE
jgi:aldose 1-epimerase